MEIKEAKMILDQVASGYIVDVHDLKSACKWALEEIEELEQGLDGWIMEEMNNEY